MISGELSMKRKLRIIIVDEKEYLYYLTYQYHDDTATNTLTVKVFLSGAHKSPLIIRFLTNDHYFIGQPLKSGVELMNTMTCTTEVVNINEPRYIRQLILLGQKKGWTGINKLEIQNGLYYLEELGFEVERLYPIKK